MEFASISWVLWRSTFTKAMRVATLEDNKRDIILNDIAPALRVAEPGKVPNCEETQQKYEVKRRKHIDSTAEKIAIQTANNQPEPSAPILTPTSLCQVEQNTERLQSLYPGVPLSVTGGAGTSQLTTPVPPNQCVSVAGTGLQNNEIKEFVINILEDRYAEAKNDLILQLRAEVTRAEEKWNERLVAIYQEAVTTNDRKNAALVAQLREEMTYNIEEKMMSLVAIKNMDSSKVASPVCERNVGPSDETGPAGEPTNVGILIPEINDETVRITFPLFYFGEGFGFELPTFVNVLQNETIEELLPVNFISILKSYFDDILSDAARNREEESKKQHLDSSTVIAVFLSLSIICCIIVVVVTRSISVLVLLIALIVLGFCWSWWTHDARIKAKRTWEREVFKRLDSYCKQLTKASPRLFQKEITIQMIKSFDHDYYTIKSAQLYRISDPSGNDIYTRVYFHVSFDIVQGNSKPDNMYEVNINQPSMIKQ